MQTVAAGGTVNTDPNNNGATPAFPLQTALTSPNAGMVTIAPGAPPAASSQFEVLGLPLQIEAPPATVADPLVITLTVDASLIPDGVDYSQLDAIRDGEAIVDCEGAGVASPDPCIEARTVLGDGDLKLTVLTSHASQWGIVVRGLQATEQKCVNDMNLDGVNVASLRAKANASCLKAAASGSEADAQGCLTSANPKVAAKVQKTITTETTKCAAAPPFGFTAASAVNSAALQSQIDLMGDLFGPDLTGAVIPSADAAGSTCQAQVLKFSQKLFSTQAKLFRKCKKNGLAGKTTLMVSASQLSRCFDEIAADAGGQIQRAVGKLADKIADKCAGVELPLAFPGSCANATDLAGCLDVRVECRLCQLFDAMDGLSESCDQFDDGVANSSCS